MSKNNEKIKDCPFCGNKSILRTEEYTDMTKYEIICSDCGATLERFDKSEVIRAWNRRSGMLITANYIQTLNLS